MPTVLSIVNAFLTQSLIPARYCRHYYDLYQPALSPVRDSALQSATLLSDVVEFKKRFYPCTWARYDLAVAGSFRLLPDADNQIEDLEHDFKEMQMMLFGQVPAFLSILEVLRQLETQINSHRGILKFSA